MTIFGYVFLIFGILEWIGGARSPLEPWRTPIAALFIAAGTACFILAGLTERLRRLEEENAALRNELETQKRPEVWGGSPALSPARSAVHRTDVALEAQEAARLLADALDLQDWHVDRLEDGSDRVVKAWCTSPVRALTARFRPGELPDAPGAQPGCRLLLEVTDASGNDAELVELVREILSRRHR